MRTGRAATYVFDPGMSATGGTDGSGNFDGTTSDFFNTSGGLGMFGNTTADTAIFGSGGTAGTVTVGTGVNVGTIDFNQVTGSYLLTGGSINLSGAATIFTDAGVTPTIASAITGTVLNKTGAGTLTLTGSDTFTSGNTSTQQAGSLVFTGNATDSFAGEFDVGGSASVAGTTTAIVVTSGTTLNVSGNFGLGANDRTGNQLLVANFAGTEKLGRLFTNYNTTNSTTALFNISGGSVAVTFGTELVQTAGATAVLNMSNGATLTFGSKEDFATSGGIANINISGNGTTLTDPSYPFLGGNGASVVTINQTGGTFFSSGVGTDGLFFNSGLITYNLSGGVLKAANVRTQNPSLAGSGLFFNGGTLQVTQNLSPNFSSFLVVPSAVIGANGGTIDTQAFNTSSSQVITGATGALTKLGTGSLAFTGASTYTGPTNVAGGTLFLSGTGSINGSGRINVNGAGARFDQLSTVASTPAITVTTGVLDGTGTVGAVTVGAGTGGIVTNGNGGTSTLTMSALTFLGVANDNVFLVGGAATTTPGQIVTNALTTPATAGAVTLNVSAGSLNNGTYDLIQYGSLLGGGLSGFGLGTVTGLGNRQTATLGILGNYVVLNVNGSLDQYTGVGSNSFQVGGPTNFRLTTTQAPIAFANGDSVVFDDTATGSTAVDIGTAVTPASTTFNNSSLSYTLSSSGGFGIGGTGALVKSGTGALTINTSNTYTGGTTLNAGTLNLGNAAAIGTGLLTITGGTLDNTTGGTVQLTNNLAVNGSFAFTGSSQLNTGTGTVTLTGNPTITVGGAGLYVNGPIGQNGTASLTLIGSGITTLATASTFTGGTTVNGSTVNFNAGGGAGTVRGPLTIINGGTVNANTGNAVGYAAGTQVTTLTVGAGSRFVLGANDNQGYRTNVVLSGGSIVAGLFDANGLPTGYFNFLNTAAGGGESYGISTTTGSSQSTISTYVQLRGGFSNAGNPALPINTGSPLLITGPIVEAEGVGSISKTGLSTLTLTDPGTDGSGTLANNVYTGGTNISQGAIRFYEQATNSTAVPINFLGTGTTNILPGGTLGGSGSTGGPVVVNGTITAGQDAATTGVMTTTGETWNASGSYVSKVNNTSGAKDGSGSDVLVMSSLNVSAGFTVTLSPLGTVAFSARNSLGTPVGAASAPVAGSYIVLARDAITSDPSSPFNSSAAIASLNFNRGGVSPVAPTDSIILSSFSDGTYYDLVAEDVAAPEPTSLLLLGILGAPAALGRRRQGRRVGAWSGRPATV